MAYSYKRSITIDHTKCGSANSTDFPVLVSFTDATFKTVGNGGRIHNANGYDINFYSDSTLTTALYYECEKYVASTGECIFWVKVPTVSSSSDTVIYIAYGDSGISTFQSTATSVWDSHYKAVLHTPDGSSLTANDSTSNANNFTKNNSPTAATGKIDGAAGLASGANLSIASLIGNQSAISLSGWFNLTGIASAGAEGISMGDHVAIRVHSTTYTALCAFYYTGSSWIELVATGNDLRNAGWKHIVYTVQAGAQKLYINGSLIVSATNAAGIGWSGLGSSTFIGKHGNGSSNFNFTGTIDEVRISSAIHTQSWITTEYNNQNSPTTFFTLGSETSLAGGSTSDFFQLF